MTGTYQFLLKVQTFVWLVSVRAMPCYAPILAWFIYNWMGKNWFSLIGSINGISSIRWEYRSSSCLTFDIWAQAQCTDVLSIIQTCSRTTRKPTSSKIWWEKITCASLRAKLALPANGPGSALGPTLQPNLSSSAINKSRSTFAWSRSWLNRPNLRGWTSQLNQKISTA